MILFLLPARVVFADTGPKPTMELVMSYRIQPAALQKAELLKCSDASCTTCTPVDMFPTLTCNAATCSSWGYGYPTYQKLRLTFADRSRESNGFRKQAFNASYTVTV